MIMVRELVKNTMMPMLLFNDQDEGDGDGPRQQVLENGCVCHYNSRNVSKVHGEHLGQNWVCGQVKEIDIHVYLSIFWYEVGEGLIGSLWVQGGEVPKPGQRGWSGGKAGRRRGCDQEKEKDKHCQEYYQRS